MRKEKEDTGWLAEFAELRFPFTRLTEVAQKVNGEDLWLVDKSKILTTEEDEQLFLIKAILNYAGPIRDYSDLTIYFEPQNEDGDFVECFGGVFDLKNRKKLSRKDIAGPHAKYGEYICASEEINKIFRKTRNKS